MTDETIRARRTNAVNELLISVVKTRVKAEADKLFGAGVSIEQINQSLPHIIFFWDCWRETMLQQCMAELDGLEHPRTTADDGPSLRAN
jgi:hypothetical protein